MPKSAVSESQKEGWLLTWPELKTRPDLMTALAEKPKFRAFFFSRLTELEEVYALLKSSKFCASITGRIYKTIFEDIQKMEKELGHRIHNQVLGVLRNRYVNLERKRGNRKAGLGIKDRHFVSLPLR